jgi:hypothetical protein
VRSMTGVEYFYRSGILYEVPETDLQDFALAFGMCAPGYFDNVSQLLDLSSGKRHLNGIQPFEKTVWVRPWRGSKEFFEHRRPRPAPSPERYDEFINQLNAENNGPKTKISNRQTFGKLLKGTYYPGGKAKPRAEQFCQWEVAEDVSLQQARELLEVFPPSKWKRVRALTTLRAID